MPEAHVFVKALLKNLGRARQKAGLSEAALEERLILGPGWVKRFETGTTVPSIDMLLAVLHETGATLATLLEGLPEPGAMVVERTLFAEETDDGIVVHFRYANHDAQYPLTGGTLEQFEQVIKTLRDGLAKLALPDAGEGDAIKTEAVANSFLRAVKTWPQVNPSDLWYFLVSRAYCDPYNHPASSARLDFAQSWKRTGGWALEEILIRHYGPFLRQRGVNLYIADKAGKQKIVDALRLSGRVEADKIDVVLTGETTGGPKFFGVVHVKASFAERRTDDVPLSDALIRGGYTSPLWTMDCKSSPGTHPINSGELGGVGDRRSAKRKDIEDEGYFSGCFSYNARTHPSLNTLPTERRVQVCNFADPDDAFSAFILRQWEAFQKR